MTWPSAGDDEAHAAPLSAHREGQEKGVGGEPLAF